MTTVYLDLAGFRARTLLPGGDVDLIESAAPGWILGQLSDWSAQIDARLAKRYEAPFAAPYPIAVLGWLARIVTVRCYLKRGVNADDEQFVLIKEDAAAALVEIKEAADAKEGLYELPLRSDTTAGGATKGLPLVATQASPYVWMDEQLDAGIVEDENRRGTY